MDVVWKIRTGSRGVAHTDYGTNIRIRKGVDRDVVCKVFTGNEGEVKIRTINNMAFLNSRFAYLERFESNKLDKTIS